MPGLLVVDGYNVLNAWPELCEMMHEVSLEAARDDLIAAMQDYAGFCGEEVVIVFDAYQRTEAAREMVKENIRVVFTGKSETADHYIERLVESTSKYRRISIRVATSDRLEQSVVLGLGAVRVSARELRKEVMMHRRRMSEGLEKRKEIKPNALEGRIPAHLRHALEQIRREGALPETGGEGEEK